MLAARFAFVLCASGAAASAGWTCCLAYPLSNPMSLIDEKAIIVWDAERKLEHFVRQASFEGEALDFGFIVPAPSEPAVAEADAAAFERLEKYVWSQMATEVAATGATTKAGGVEVIDQYMVGDYEVTILKGTDGGSILDWLQANNYDSRPAMEDWLDHYAKMDWFFAALKFVRPEDANTPETTAVRVSFETDVPFYPYKMPDDTWPDGHYRPIVLYFVSGGVSRGFYRQGSEDWEANVQWSGALPREEATGLATEIGLTVDDIPEAPTLTVFHNTQNAQGYDTDVYFLTYTSVLPTWAVLLVLALIAAGLVYLFVTRKRQPAQDST